MSESTLKKNTAQNGPIFDRRQFFRTAGALAASTLVLPLSACGGGGGGSDASEPVLPKPEQTSWLAPKEAATHTATWMVYGATASAWGTPSTTNSQLAIDDIPNSRPVAREDLMRIAAQLSRFETVNVLVDNETDRGEANAYLDLMFAASPASAKNRMIKRSLADLSDPAVKFGIEGYINYLEPAGMVLPPMNRANIVLIVQHVNDLWARDTGPVFVKGTDAKIYGVNFNFNGWGQENVSTGLTGWVKDTQKAANGVVDQDIDGDKKVATFINNKLGTAEIKTWITMEGGGIEVNGRGLAVATDSCIINNNRNPGKTRADFETEIKRVLGVEKLIWVPGVKAQEVTDDHIDFSARFTDDNTIIYNWDGGTVSVTDPTPSHDGKIKAALLAYQAQVAGWSAADKLKYLGSANASLNLVELPQPKITLVKDAVNSRNPDVSMSKRKEFEKSFGAGYIGYYEANNCILMGQFGDSELDKAAFNSLRARYPERVIIQITTDGIANGGGTIHCATQQQIV
ncbi:agmatine/peptidylarginine deiminase [Undibacterium rugosum]|uniref:Agmatine deiminase family protein n=1 Tax=Undibacterium rugosum TaxID=2762291 RepID=A0A923I1G1_9BURK|nr:agmatine deiminase family protein [Undibacterium rugosum]MBC3935911.1 agmatine deiminase family protein [Undibacterium rugosum]MBR7779306.1 agmatine deiminase family protein [Undibacterium rugosum]